MKPRRNVITIFVIAILVTMFGQTDIAKSQMVTDGLVSYWTFDAADIAGQTAKDVWGDRDGTIIGNTHLTAGKIGDALQFDGAGDYVEFDDAGLPEGNALRTMSVWVKPEGTTVRAVLEWGSGGTAERCSVLIEGANRVRFVDQAGGATTTGAVANGEWHYICQTYDGTDLRIYIDGVLDTKVAKSIANINTVLKVGRIGANVKVPDEFFNGAIDEVSIYDRPLSAEEVAQNFAAEEGLSTGGIADVVYPDDGAVDVPREAMLNWKPGEFANTHDVYFGTVFGDVNDADRNNPMGVLAGRDQIAATYFPGRLDLGQTYYWRIDEVNAPPDSTIYKGDLWRFTTEPIGYPIQNITATASSSLPGMGPENTVNGSGMDADGMHSAEQGHMWLSNSEPQGAWIQFEFDKVYKLHEIRVWNSNQMVESLVGFGLKSVAIEYSTDGTDWTELSGAPEFAQAPGTTGYAHNTTVDMDGVTAKYVRITANSNWGFLTQYGLSEVRFLYVPVWAREPNPASGATDVSVDTLLDWRAGREAAGHDVYLSTDEQAVIDGTAPVTSLTEASYASSLDVASTYYWRIDEVNDAEAPSSQQGNVWTFSTQEYIVVDDFESYNDTPAGEDGSNLVYLAWIDGFDNPSANGSTMGYVTGTSLETGNVHAGGKSVPLAYNNTSAGLSEVVRSFTPAQDWAAHGVKTLSLWFAGDGANVPGQLYVKVNGVQVNYDGDAANLAVTGWQTWNIDLAAINTNLSNVTSMTIGIQGPGATGTLLLDDIRLYSYDRELITPAEPGAAGLQAHYEFEGNTNDSSGNARHGTAAGNPLFGQGKIGQAIGLDGLGDFVNIDGYKGVLGSSAITVSAWIKTSNTDTGAIVGWGSNLVGERFGFRVDVGRLRLEHQGGNVQGDTSVNDGAWHHVAVTVQENVTISYPDVILYLDGTDDTRATTDPDPFNLTAADDVSIGRRPSVDDRYFIGQIDDVRIYDRALTQEEINWLAGRTQPSDRPF